MKKTDIYFKGDIIGTVECDGVHRDLSTNATMLITEDNVGLYKTVAVVPFDHLIIFREDVVFELKGSDLVDAIENEINRNAK
jgi:hypothetical protein